MFKVFGNNGRWNAYRVFISLMMVGAWAMILRENHFGPLPSDVQPAESLVRLSDDALRMYIGGDYGAGYTCQVYPKICSGNDISCPNTCTVVGMSCGSGGANFYQVKYQSPQTCSDPGDGTITCSPAEVQFAVCYYSTLCFCEKNMGVLDCGIPMGATKKPFCTSSPINPGLNECPYVPCSPP